MFYSRTLIRNVFTNSKALLLGSLLLTTFLLILAACGGDGNGSDGGSGETEGDTTRPTITLLGPNPMTLSVGDTYNEPGATARDEVDGDITSSIVMDSSAVDTSTSGSYQVTYNVSDAAGNAAIEAVRTVNVGDAVTGDYIHTPYYDVKRDHPRLLIDQGTLSRLRSYACYDDSGNTVNGCTPTDRWNHFVSAINVNDPDDYGREAWHFALLYKVTQNTLYRDTAIAKLNDQLDIFFDDVRFDSYLHDGDTIKNVALCFDWLYDDLDQTTKHRIIGYVNQASYEILHGVWNATQCPCDEGGSSCPDTGVAYNCTWSGWGLHQPLNNYHYSHMMALAYTFITMIGEPGGDDYIDYMEAFYNHTYGVNGDLENLELYGNGGGWMEGMNYNYPAKMRLTDAYQALATATRTNYFEQLAFLHDLPYYQFAVIQPGLEYVVPIGDLARSSAMQVYDYDWILIGTAARYLPDGEAKAMAQYWRSHTRMPYGGLTQSGWHTPTDFLLYEENASETDYRTLLSHHAPGSGFANARSSWDADAVSITLSSTCYFESHQNPDQNTFLIWRDGWQIVDDNTYTASGIVQNTLGENTFYINGAGQNARIDSMRLDGDPANQDLCGHIAHFEEAGAYVFMEGDAAGVYDTLSVYDRQIVFIRPDIVVLHDKVQSTNALYTKQLLLHFGSTPTVAGNLISHSEGGGKVFVRNLLPAGAAITTASDSDIGASSSRALISAPTGVAYTSYLNVLYVPDSSVGAMLSAELIDGTGMEGAVIDDAHIVMFSKTTSTVTSASFPVAGSGARTVILTDLTSNGSYTVSETGGIVTVSSGGPLQASDQGTLSTTIDL